MWKTPCEPPSPTPAALVNSVLHINTTPNHWPGIILVFGGLRDEDWEFEAFLGYRTLSKQAPTKQASPDLSSLSPHTYNQLISQSRSHSLHILDFTCLLCLVGSLKARWLQCYLPTLEAMHSSHHMATETVDTVQWSTGKRPILCPIRGLNRRVLVNIRRLSKRMGDGKKETEAGMTWGQQLRNRGSRENKQNKARTDFTMMHYCI